MTGGRLKRVSEYIDQEDFCFTYGDGLADLDIRALIKFHKSQGTLATVTSVQPPGRFGALEIDKKIVKSFIEKPQGEVGAINGGFFVLSPKVIDHIAGDHTTWEQEPLKDLANMGQLSAFKHGGFWQPMDTLRDKVFLESLWKEGKAPWKRWK